MFLWSRKEMEDILLQLEAGGQLFERCRFCRSKDGFSLLGTGGFACVYEAENIRDSRKRYALKVIGFGDKYVESDAFQKSASAQRNIGRYRDSMIQIYDYKELCVELDRNNQVISILPQTEKKPEQNCLTLQFILMEKCRPILAYDKMGNAYLTCQGLHKRDEKEILKLAFDIGKALSLAHDKNVIHRDVKLENIFYDAGKKVYKLGDFGIAKVTDNGMASTMAYTKGYGAPEIVTGPEEQYDNTADIYSFGILLYLLLNDLQFPDSDDYHSNTAKQYSQGYVLPKPRYGSEKLIAMVTRMCRYEPEERYQNADELLDDLEGLYLDCGYHYKKQHCNGAVAVGSLFLLVGTVMLKLTVHPELSLPSSVWLYILLGLALLKCVWDIRRKKMPGIVLGQIAGMAGVINIMTLIEKNNGSLPLYSGYAWLGPAFISMGVILNFQVFILKERDRKVMPYYFKANFYWICMFAFYLVLILHAWTFGPEHASILRFLPMGEWMSEIAVRYDIAKVGIAGAIFVLVWNVREWVLRFTDKKANASITTE